jgi:serine/threonine-protein phosphatase PP1 catalytic subunit
VFPGKDGERVYNQFDWLFAQLPLAIRLGKRTLGMHGDISPRLGSLDSIRNIQRPFQDPDDNTLAFDLLWSDPDPKFSDFAFNKKRKRSYYFGKDAVEARCEKHNINMIVRAHEPPLPGYLTTIFLAPGNTDLEVGTINIGAC